MKSRINPTCRQALHLERLHVQSRESWHMKNILCIAIRVTVGILVITSLVHDTVWAHSDAFSDNRLESNNLQADSLFKQADSPARVYARLIYEFVEKSAWKRSGKRYDQLSLEDVIKALEPIKDKQDNWFKKNNCQCVILDNEVLIGFSPGYILRYFRNDGDGVRNNLGLELIKMNAPPRHVYSDEAGLPVKNIKSGSPMPDRQSGISAGKARLDEVNFNQSDYYFTLGDMDRLSRFNKIYSKALMGSASDKEDTDVVVPGKVILFKEILRALMDACGERGFDVYRYLAGDEFVPQGGFSNRDDVEKRLNIARNSFRRYFDGRYAVAKICNSRKLSDTEKYFLHSREDVLSVARYADGYHVLLQRRGGLKAQLLSINTQMRLFDSHLALVPHEFNNGILGPFTISMGSISAKSIIKELEKQRGQKILDEETCRIKGEYLNEVYTWGMRIANDMLQKAKEKRDDVCVRDDLKGIELHTQIEQETQTPVNQGIDRLTTFYDQESFRSHARRNLIQLEISTYNGDPSRDAGGFHAVNAALGYDDANDVIAILAKAIKDRFPEEKFRGVVFGRAPPDKFFISFEHRIPTDSLSNILTYIKRDVQDALEKRFGSKMFAFNIEFKVSVVSADAIKDATIDEFKNRSRVIDIISKLEKVIEMTSKAGIASAVDIAEALDDGNKAGEIRTYNPDKDKVLYENYRLIQAREKAEAIEELSSEHSTAPPASDIFDGISCAALTMGQTMSKSASSIEDIIPETRNNKGIILYADDLLERGAAADLALTLKETNILENSTIVLYGRKPGRVELLEKIIKAVGVNNKIKIISLTPQDLNGRNCGEAINVEYFDEAKELEALIRHSRSRGISNGNTLGVIKGVTSEAYVEGIRAISKSEHTGVVSFTDDLGVYSFREALRLLIAIKNDVAPPAGKEWFKLLKPIEKEDIEKAYQDYRRALEAAISA